MKLSETLKEKAHGATEVIKKHKTKIIGGVVIVCAVGGAYLYYKGCKKPIPIALQKPIEFETVKGEGPIWEKLKAIFQEFGVNPGDIWMLEAGQSEEAGLAQLAHIRLDHPTEIMEFPLT